MLVNFSLENWMSFRDRVTFSMVGSRERQHGERVPRLKKYHTRILPIAALYGGNASGKTNFFEALSFARRLVVRGTQPEGLIPVAPFRLDGNGVGQPSRFCFELLVDETIYEFSFAVTREAVLEEKLVEIKSTVEKVLYDRREGKPNFSKALSKNKFLNFTFEGTRDNQLFLTNSISQKVKDFQPVHDWFKDSLVLITPESHFQLFEQVLDEGHPFFAIMNEALPQLDTGITHLAGEEIPFENIPLPGPLKAMFQGEIKEGMAVQYRVRQRTAEQGDDRFIVTRKDGELTAKRLVAYHLKEDGTEARFEMNQESAGTLRVLDLLPAFFRLSAQGSRKVVVIDEIDRSLHTLLTRRLLTIYLENYSSVETRSQLLLTTHDLSLMDQQLLRRDEMWVAERDISGASTLLSFSDYKDIRYDKDIRRSYLQGRMGGIPGLLLGDFSSNTPPLKSPLPEEGEGDD